VVLALEAVEDVDTAVLAVRDAIADVTAAATEEGSAAPGVGKPFTTLPATDSMIDVGIETPLLDSTAVTSPTMLDKRSPICLR
jgi:hypothetical protein